MLFLIRQTLRAGICTEPTPGPNDDWRLEAERIQADVLALLGRALTIRQVDAGSCNGCELEIHALNNPYYNIEGLGIRFVASPRHADMLLVTGPVARNMQIAVQAGLRGHARAEARRRCRRLRLHRRNIRRELRQLRPSRQRDPGRCRDPGLPAAAARDPPRDPHRDIDPQGLIDRAVNTQCREGRSAAGCVRVVRQDAASPKRKKPARGRLFSGQLAR